MIFFWLVMKPSPDPFWLILGQTPQKSETRNHFWAVRHHPKNDITQKILKKNGKMGLQKCVTFVYIRVF